MSIKTDHFFFACMLFFVIALNSCTKIIDFKGEESDPLLVIEATLQPNIWYDPLFKTIYYGILYYNLQSTQFFLDTTSNSFQKDDAECFLQHNDDPFIKVFGSHYIRKPINVGDVFRLKVTHPDYPTLTTEIVVPDFDDFIVKIDSSSLKLVSHGILNQPSYQFDVIIDSKTKSGSNVAFSLDVFTKLKSDTSESYYSHCWSDDPIIYNNLLYQGYNIVGAIQGQKCMNTPVYFPLSDITTWPYRFSLMIPAEVIEYDFNEERCVYDEFLYCNLVFSIVNLEFLEYLSMMRTIPSESSILSEPMVIISPNVEGGLGCFWVKKSVSVNLTKEVISELLSK